MLSLMILLPFVAAALLFALPGDDARRADTARWITLAVTVVLLALGLVLWARFDTSTAAFQFTERLDLFGGLFTWHLGIDGISLVLIVLSVFLMPLCILAGWRSVDKRVVEYLASFLAMEATMIGVFASLDLYLFYIFFEAGLIPMYLIIGIWGGKRRIYASYKFFLYTLLGSVLMLLAMIWMSRTAGTTDIPALMAYDFPVHAQTWLFLAFFASFAVKMPMWPVHTWLPDAHVEAPTAGSMILAGVLLKMGGYGFLRFSLPMFPEASVQLAWLVWALSMVAVVYTSLVALAQSDMKKLIAYSSVAHMAFVTGGLFAFNTQGLEGAIVVMLAHGLVSAGLFYCVGVIYDRLHTREIAAYGGVTSVMPRYGIAFLLFTMAAVALPGTANFVGEFTSLAGMFRANTWLGAVMTTGIILSAAYSLWLYWRVGFGEVRNPDVAAMPRLEGREQFILAALSVPTIWFGFHAEPLMKPLRAPVAAVLARLERAQPPAVSARVPAAPPVVTGAPVPPTPALPAAGNTR